MSKGFLGLERTIYNLTAVRADGSLSSACQHCVACGAWVMDKETWRTNTTGDASLTTDLHRPGPLKVLQTRTIT
eukprot:3632688-Amphidinium_carterae.1